jgi:hypothetical protein
MKFAEARPYAEPEEAARKLIEIANSVEAVQSAGSTLRRSTGRFSSRSKDHRPNMTPG